MQKILDVRATSVAEMLDTTGGKLAVETHVSGQKANWKFQGAREAFMEGKRSGQCSVVKMHLDALERHGMDV